jgi:predicted dehydrogenase
MAVDGVDLVAVCDLNQEKAARCAEGLDVGIYKSYRAMLDREDLDIVSVCTPPETHACISCVAARTPGARAVYCEKPITMSVSMAERIVRTCEERGVLLMINHQRRFGPLHQEVARIIQEGELGRIQQVTCYYGDGIANAGSHLFDLLRFYFGEVGVIDGWWSPNASHRPGDPNVDGRLWLEGGIPIAIQACDCRAYAIFEIDILGTDGRLRVREGGRRAEIAKVISSPTFEGIQELSAPRDLPQSIPHAAPSRWIPRGIEHLLDCLETGTQPISSGRDGLAALKIIEALKSSARGE